MLTGRTNACQSRKRENLSSIERHFSDFRWHLDSERWITCDPAVPNTYYVKSFWITSPYDRNILILVHCDSIDVIGISLIASNSF